VGKDESPESLPFVANIKKGCLVHLAQDGLFLDHLQAEVKKVCGVTFTGLGGTDDMLLTALATG
jgi:hypothetical protein